MSTLFPIGLEWSNEIELLFSFLIGIGFGFALERGGFGNSRKLALQFYFRDLTVFKVMFSAIATAMTGIIILSSLGWLDISNVYINPTYIWPGIAGGLIMGIGFAIGGYCPGTSVVGLATFKIDAIYYLLGTIIGVGLFGETVPLFMRFFSGDLSGFLGTLRLSQILPLSTGVVGFLVVCMALGGFWGAEILEKKITGGK